MSHETDALPNSAKTFLAIFNRAGFPAIAFGVVSYLCFVTLKEQTKTMMDFKEVMIQVKDSIDMQNKILRHRSKDD